MTALGVSDWMCRSPSFKNSFCSFILHFSGLITIRFFLDPALNSYFDLTIRGTDKMVKMLSRVVNITVHSTIWMTVTVLKCRRLHFSCMPYIHFKSTHLHITVFRILIERDLLGYSYTFISGLTKIN